MIAAQAVITGAFSVTRQAVQLGYLPRMLIRHTSEHEIGQVYVPAVNTILLVAVAVTVLSFGTSDALAAAYGLAVTGTMGITTILAFVYLRRGAGWPLWGLLPLFGLFLALDIAFLAVNLMKLPEGGWLPLAIGGIVFTVMATWIWGRRRIAAQRAPDVQLGSFIETLGDDWPPRVPGTGVYMTAHNDLVPAAMLHKLKLSGVLHARNVVMTVRTEEVPHIDDSGRLEIRRLARNFHSVTVRYGFFQTPDIPRALALCSEFGLPFELSETTFYIGRQKIWPVPRSGLGTPFKRLFVRLSRLSLDATEFFRIPVDRVAELGGQVEL